MPCLKFSILFCAGALLVGLAVSTAQSQETAPRDPGKNWDNGPARGGPNGPHHAGGPRRPDNQGAEANTPPGPMDDGDGPHGDRPQPPGRHHGPHDENESDVHGPHPDGPGNDGPGGPDGAGHQHGPPGMRMDLEMLKSRDPELYKLMQADRDLERQTRELGEKYRSAGKDEQAKLKTTLAETVDKHFAVRQQLRTLEVTRLEQQVKELHERIEQREKNRKDIVAKRVGELAGTDDAEHF